MDVIGKELEVNKVMYEVIQDQDQWSQNVEGCM